MQQTVSSFGGLSHWVAVPCQYFVAYPGKKNLMGFTAQTTVGIAVIIKYIIQSDLTNSNNNYKYEPFARTSGFSVMQLTLLVTK
jgi:hypothetical protein